MRAFLKNNRQAPRKVRLVASAFIGKKVNVALSELSFMPHKASFSLSKVIHSAVSNAKQKDSNLKEDNLIIKNITVDKGITYKRYRPRAFGRAAPIHKESSHIHVILDVLKEEDGDKDKNKKSVKEKKVEKSGKNKIEKKEKKIEEKKLNKIKKKETKKKN